MGKIVALFYVLGVFWYWYTIYNVRVHRRGLADAINSFRRDIQFYGFGGFERRLAWVKETVQRGAKMNILDQGAFSGRTRRIWTYREVHEQGMYDACAYDVFDPSWKFWLSSVIAPIFWPIVLPLKIAFGFLKFLWIVICIRFRKNSA